jgi:hypothetical protein
VCVGLCTYEKMGLCGFSTLLDFCLRLCNPLNLQFPHVTCDVRGGQAEISDKSGVELKDRSLKYRSGG